MPLDAPDTDLSGRFRTTAFWRALPAGMRRRWWMFRPLDLIARHWPVFKKRRGVLVVRMDGIGDMVLFRRALDHYADVFGVEKSDITVLGCESWGRLAGEVFSGYRVHAIDEHAYARRPFYRFRVSLWVRGLAPEVAVCDSYMRRALMADSLAWVSGANRTVSSLPYVSERTRSEFNYYLSQADEIIDTGTYPTHEVTRHFRFLSALAGRTIAPEVPQISWRDAPPAPDGWDGGEDGKPYGDAEGAPYAVLNPGSNEPGRRWPLGHYAAIARRLLKQGLRVVFVGRPDEQGGGQAVAALAEEQGVIDLTGKTVLPQLLDLMKRASLVVSNDTGPAHLAIALGRPTVVIVGGGHFGSFVPYPVEATPPDARFVYQEMECYHCFWRCHKRADKFQLFPCIGAISEDQVWAACEELLHADMQKKPGAA
ncbi:MAG: glycosyltransferase family 9 protein [Rhodospirillales bacterium]|nr:glycosyltransferase family 9 protein [Alphaproteobacteria bacterium]MBL6948420.1 glycosyltransferase family 9 protein [Rhodospirillales bacterium]